LFLASLGTNILAYTKKNCKRRTKKVLKHWAQKEDELHTLPYKLRRLEFPIIAFNSTQHAQMMVENEERLLDFESNHLIPWDHWPAKTDPYQPDCVSTQSQGWWRQRQRRRGGGGEEKEKEKEGGGESFSQGYKNRRAQLQSGVYF